MDTQHLLDPEDDRVRPEDFLEYISLYATGLATLAGAGVPPPGDPDVSEADLAFEYAAKDLMEAPADVWRPSSQMLLQWREVYHQRGLSAGTRVWEKMQLQQARSYEQYCLRKELHRNTRDSALVGLAMTAAILYTNSLWPPILAGLLSCCLPWPDGGWARKAEAARGWRGELETRVLLAPCRRTLAPIRAQRPW